MQNMIKELKQRIERNYKIIQINYEDICDLIKPVLEAINLLLLVNASDERIKIYLKSVSGSIKIIEEKLSIIEKNKK